MSHTHPDGTRGLEAVNLEIDSGTVVGIAGRNGSGKTTLLRLVAGLARPSSGVITVAGLDAGRLSVQQLARQVGLSFQEPDDQLFETTVLREAEAGASTPESALAALQLVGLERRSGEHPQDLGYSRRKLLTIAAVVAMETPVVALDEPTAGQDADGRQTVLQVLRHLRERGRTVVVASHDLDLMSSALDGVHSLPAGRL